MQEERAAVMYVLLPSPSIARSNLQRRSDKMRDHRTKEDSTMAMLRQLAADRYGQ